MVVLFAMPLAASASGPCLSQTLSRGSRGSEVVTLQKFLVSKNLLAAEGATGYFGLMTEAAVQKWQMQHGPVAAGTPMTTGFGAVGSKTRALLCNATSATASTAITPAPIAYPSATTSSPAAAPTVQKLVATSNSINYLPGAGNRPDVWSFRVSANTIQIPGELVTLNWTVYDAASCAIKTLEDQIVATNLAAIGEYDVRPDKPVTYVLTCTGNGDGSTSTPAMAYTMRSVQIVNLPPTCKIAFDKETYKFGDTIKLSWTSIGADYGTWQQNIGDYYPMPYGKIATEGQYFFGVNGAVSQTVRLVMTGRGGIGACSASVSVSAPTASRSFFSQVAALGAGFLYPPRDK